MKLKSLGYRSELVFTSFDGQVDDRGDYLIMRTLTNPNYFWGNLLVFDRPPRAQDTQQWIQLFKQEFPDPRIYHQTFAWDSPGGEIGDVSGFEALGFELEAKTVMAAGQVKPPPRFNEVLEVRPLRTLDEWQAMVELQIESAHDHLNREEWTKFYSAQAVRYQAMVKAQRGEWYGGFLGGRLVCGLGLFHHEGLARFQIVATHPDFRRQGLCGTLVYRAATQALQTMPIQELVMCADPSYFALKIYESVGFAPILTEHGVCWWDKTRHEKR